VPEIRFAGFSGEWAERKLSELMDFSNGINAPKESYGNGRKMISVLDILDQNPIRYENIRNSVEVKKEIEDKNRVEKGDLVFVRSSEVVEEVGWAKAYLEDEYALYSGFSIRGKKKDDYDARFIELNLNSSSRKQIERKAGGSTRFNVTQTILKSIVIREPNIEEQTKLGHLIKHLDDTIAIHQQELTTLKQTKRGFLQKMFPKEGESVPEARLPGFNGKWKRCKLREFGKATGGTSLESEFVDKGKYKVINIGSYSENSTYTDQGIRAMETEKTKRRVLDKGDLTMILNDKTSSGRIIGRVLLISEDNSYVYNQRTERIEPDKNNYDSQFLYQLLNAESIRSKIVRLAQGNTQIYVNWSSISDIEYLIPTIEEQTKIGNFFKQLDDTIALHEHELDTLKQTKKAFLQKMFI